MKWSNKVEIVEQTNDRLVVRETPHYGAAFLFLSFGILGFILMVGGTSRNQGLIVVAIAFAWLLFLGFYSLVESTITVSRGEMLQVRRSLLGVQRTRGYSLEEVQGVALRKTWRHGEGLRLQFMSGKSKGLTMSLHFQYLGDEQLALDGSIRAFRKHRKVKPDSHRRRNAGTMAD